MNNTHEKTPSLTLLIVDDSPLIVAKMEELLNDMVCIGIIKSCGTFAEAAELLNQYKPDLVLLDINLPDKSGIQLLKYIKPLFPEAGIIMVSNQPDDFYKILSLQLGANHYLDKSKDFEKLATLIASYC